VANLEKEADQQAYGLDSMLLREAVRAQAKGVEQVVRTPQGFIDDLTDTIDALNEELNGSGEN